MSGPRPEQMASYFLSHRDGEPRDDLLNGADLTGDQAVATANLLARQKRRIEQLEARIERCTSLIGACWKRLDHEQRREAMAESAGASTPE